MKKSTPLEEIVLRPGKSDMVMSYNIKLLMKAGVSWNKALHMVRENAKKTTNVEIV